MAQPLMAGQLIFQTLFNKCFFDGLIACASPLKSWFFLAGYLDYYFPVC